MPGDFAPRLRVVVDPPEIVPARHRRERAVQRENLQSVPREIELADDLRAQEGHDVRCDGELETGENFFGDSGAAEYMPALEHEDFAPGLREVCGVDEPVVSAPDHNHVVLHHLDAAWELTL